jgi:hypothetical protein
MLNQENQSMKKKTAWRWWAKALGEKASKCDKESDKVAIIRSFIFATYLITNAFIVAGVIRHWNDETKIEVFVETSNTPEYQTPPMKVSNRSFEFE